MLAGSRPYGAVPVEGTAVKLKGAAILQAAGQWPYWAQFWRDWDWPTIAQTVDALAAVGVNCLQVTATGLPDNGVSHPDVSTMRSRIGQLATFAAGRRMMLNPQLGYQPSHSFAGGAAAATLAAVQMARLFVEQPNIVFIDAMNEVNLYAGPGWSGPSGQALSDMTVFVGGIRQVVGAVPITVSVGATSISDIAGPWTQIYAALSDFHNIHTYHYQESGTSTVAASDFAALRSATWFLGRFVVGETGMPSARGPTAQATWLSGNGIVAAAQDCLGSILWGARDTSAAPGRSEDVSGFGMIDATGALRTTLAAQVQAWPGGLW